MMRDIYGTSGIREGTDVAQVIEISGLASGPGHERETFPRERRRNLNGDFTWIEHYRGS
jgi:hypothetical protein